MRTIMFCTQIAIVSLLLCITLSDCGIRGLPEKNTEAFMNNQEKVKVDYRNPDSTEETETFAELKPTIHVEDQESEKQRKPEVDAITLFLSLIFTSSILCLLILVFTHCYQSYFQKQEVDHNQVVFHRVPTGFAVMPGHIIWQTFNDPIMTSTQNAMSAPRYIADTFKVTHQSAVSGFQPETPPPPYRETTEEVI